RLHREVEGGVRPEAEVALLGEGSVHQDERQLPRAGLAALGVPEAVRVRRSGAEARTRGPADARVVPQLRSAQLGREPLRGAPQVVVPQALRRIEESSLFRHAADTEQVDVVCQRGEKTVAARFDTNAPADLRGDLRDARARRLLRRKGPPVLVEPCVALVRERQQAEDLVQLVGSRWGSLVERQPERVEQRVEGVAPLGLHYSRERRAGKRITSRIASLPVMAIVSRSIPIPQPPVGGIPYESASTKSGSPGSDSSAPASRSASCIATRCACSSASLSSLNAFANSIPATTHSNRSTIVS